MFCINVPRNDPVYTGDIWCRLHGFHPGHEDDPVIAGLVALSKRKSLHVLEGINSSLFLDDKGAFVLLLSIIAREHSYSV